MQWTLLERTVNRVLPANEIDCTRLSNVLFTMSIDAKIVDEYRISSSFQA